MKSLLSILVATLIFPIAGCCLPRTESGRMQMDIAIRNHTGHVIRLQAGGGLFSQTIELKPGERWYGYIPTIFVPDLIEIKLTTREKK